ncbi:MAG: RNA polymerase subunit sigma-70 [Acidimicrobiales bacterium]
MTRLAPEDEDALLSSARQGDEGAYGELVEGHRAELRAHCYRMLASFDDAEDAVQEALTRAWRGLPSFEAPSSIRTWLFKIATNTAIDVARRRARRGFPLEDGRRAGRGESPGEALMDAPWIEPYPDRLIEDSETSPEARYEARESLELAFVLAIQHLPHRQRAVLILREVLGYSASEVADLLDTTAQAVNSALQRARATAAARLPARSQQLELRLLGDDGMRELAHRYAVAIERNDVDTLLSMLTEDATWAMPPHPVWYQGHAAIAEFHANFVSSESWRHIATRANGQLAVEHRIKGAFTAAVYSGLGVQPQGRSKHAPSASTARRPGATVGTLRWTVVVRLTQPAWSRLGYRSEIGDERVQGSPRGIADLSGAMDASRRSVRRDRAPRPRS